MTSFWRYNDVIITSRVQWESVSQGRKYRYINVPSMSIASEKIFVKWASGVSASKSQKDISMNDSWLLRYQSTEVSNIECL